MKQRHTLIEVDIETRTAICQICGLTRVRLQGGEGGPNRKQIYRCNSASHYINGRTRRQKIARAGYDYSIHKGGFCEECGFVATDSCQLDVDHIDDNKFNNELSNLRTLCANCHRLKTKESARKIVTNLKIRENTFENYLK